MKETATPREVLNRHLELSRSNPEQGFLECYREDPLGEGFIVLASLSKVALPLIARWRCARD